jgi:hypothetical protein
MPMTLEQIEKEVVLLPEDERVLLVDFLSNTLITPDKELDRIWGEESERRSKAVKDGSLETFSTEEVFAEARKKIAVK